MSLLSSRRAWNNLRILPEWNFYPAHSGTQLYVVYFATQQTLQSFIIFDRIAQPPRNDLAAKQNYPAPASHERNSDSFNK